MRGRREYYIAFMEEKFTGKRINGANEADMAFISSPSHGAAL
jgi:hypothetical protein